MTEDEEKADVLNPFFGIRPSQHGFMKGRLANLISVYDKETPLMHEERAVAVYLRH